MEKTYFKLAFFVVLFVLTTGGTNMMMKGVVGGNINILCNTTSDCSPCACKEGRC
ncbi:hypothetical protein LINPERHAP1_LOCUS31276, partial [Linum perenne]